MYMKELVFGLILLMQACEQLLAQTPASIQPDSPGILQRLAEKTREATAAVKHLRGFIGTYYEDHIQPVTDSYVEWASNVKSTVWEKIQTTIDKLIPLKATNQTAQPTQI
ncbi:apolipoprotein C-IV [Sander lucioperca]|uniref:apolipoprotein C-IV n=1 Tax=Sander lucioperca TaxID=283035 RepID=UPI00165383FB|nr:apolipoprotein C-IV [Sander lucioperca]